MKYREKSTTTEERLFDASKIFPKRISSIVITLLGTNENIVTLREDLGGRVFNKFVLLSKGDTKGFVLETAVFNDVQGVTIECSSTETIAIRVNEELSSFPNVVAIAGRWSVRDLDGLANAWRVRRDSDNAETDISYSGGLIDETALDVFCTGANCFLRTWYGKDNENLEQTTLSNQPKVYDSATGIVKDLASNVAPDFNGAWLLNLTINVSSQPITTYTATSFLLDPPTAVQVILDGDSATPRLGFAFFGGSYDYFAVTDVILGGIADDIDIPKTLAIQYDGANSFLRKNGALLYSGNPGTQAINGITVGNRFDFSTPSATIKINELVITQGSFMSSIESSQVSAFVRPVITNVSPLTGGTGAVVTITGYYFTGASAVSFGGTSAQLFVVDSDTQITATVGVGSSGNVEVTAPFGIAIFPGFVYTP